MNKNLYRIVFNQARGMLMVVADIARAAHGSPSSGIGHTHRQRIGKLSALKLSLMFALGAVYPAQAQIIADEGAPKNQQPTVMTSSNGTPQVNIQTPSAAGVSRNVYSQFDVDQKGAILNNSHKQIQTATGGWVEANPWLAKGEAKIILNEVNSRNPSQLSGIIEVAGQKAQVVIANPSGITCSGCGFINANWTTLTTGQVLINKGSLTGYSVERGEVTVNGAGMDSSRQDYTDIIARTTKINAGIWANELNVTTGRNKVDITHQKIEKQSEESSTRPQVAVDVAHLGGMYANKIRLVGTEHGVGVRNDGNIGSVAGTVVVTADGRIENSGSIDSSRELTLISNQGISNTGTLSSQNEMQLKSGGEIGNGGTVASQDNLQLASQGEVNNSGTLIARTQIRVTSTNDVKNSGTLGAQTQNVTVTADGRVENDGEVISSQGKLSVSAKKGIRNNGTFSSQSSGVLTSGAEFNSSGTLYTLNDIHIEAAGSLNNSGVIFSQGDAQLVSSTDIRNSGTLLSHNNASLTSAGDIFNSGSQAAAGHLQLQSASLHSTQGSQLAAGVLADGSLGNSGDLRLTTTGELLAQGQNLAAGDFTAHGLGIDLSGSQTQALNITVDAQTANLLTQNAQVFAQNNLTALTATTLDNDGGTLSANSLSLSAFNLSNQSGDILQFGNDALLLEHAGQINNTSGRIASNGENLTLRSALINNQQGQIIHAGSGDFHLQAQTLRADGGQLLSNGRLDLQGGDFVLDGATTSAQKITLDSENLSHRGGQMIQNGSGEMTVTVHQRIDNQGGILAANGGLHIRAAALDNQNGSVIAASEGSLTLSVSGEVNNQQGELAASQNLTLEASLLSNHQGWISAVGGDARLHTSEAIDNSEGLIEATNGLDLISAGLNNQTGQLVGGNVSIGLSAFALNNTRGVIAASERLRINSGFINNDEGLLQSPGDMDINTHDQTLSNRNSGETGGILSGGALNISSGGMDNQQGLLVGKNAYLQTGDLNNQGGQLIALQSLTLSSQVLNNEAGLLQSTGDMLIDTHGQRLSNRNSGEMGGIFSEGALTLFSDALDNVSGVLVSMGNAVLSTGSVDNRGGQLVSWNQFTLNSQTLNNAGGLLQSAGNMVVDTQGNALSNNDGGEINSQGELRIHSAALDNQKGLIASAAGLTLGSDSLNNFQGTVLSYQDLSATTLALNNQGGIIQALGNITLNTQGRQLDNRNDGFVGSEGSLRLFSGDVLNSTGALYSAADAAFEFTLLDNRGGQVAAQKSLGLSGAVINNDDGGLIQSGDTLALSGDTLSNHNSGDAGGITSQAAMTIKSGGFDNSAGVVIAGASLELDSTILNNQSGILVAQQALNARTFGLNNNNGLVQSGGDFQWNAQQGAVNNQDGTLYSLNSFQLSGGSLNNKSGTFGAKGDMVLNVTDVDNSAAGRIISEHQMALYSAAVNNQQGQIQAVGDLLLESAQDIIDNTRGLIRSGANLTLDALALINNSTQDNNLGIEGQSVSLNTGTLDNQHGSILADKQLSITNAAKLDNRDGLLSAGDTLQLQGLSLNLVNTHGIVQAGNLLDIHADTLGGDGQLLSLNDFNITSVRNFTNSGEVIANGNLTFTTSGDVTNSGEFLAGQKLDLHATNLTNTLEGEFNAGQDWLTVTQTLTNYGLIDGVHTRLQAGTLNNIGTGRIYGDAVSVQAVTFNNLAQNGKAAVLAGREQVEIGVQTLNNRDHALIYSGGTLSIGGTLDATHQATGRATTVNNRSATIESADSMWISAGKINNINEHFSTELVTLSVEEMKEYQLKGFDTRWQEDEIQITNSEVNFLHTPESADDDYTEFDFTRTEQETQILTSDPAQIIAGGNLIINADQLLNDKSQIIAGGTLAITAKKVDNVEVAGEHLTTDIGTAIHYYRKRNKGRDSQKSDNTPYTPPAVIQTIAIKPGTLVDHGKVTGNTLVIANGTTAQAHAALGYSGSVSNTVDGSDVVAAFTANSTAISSITPGDVSIVQPVVLNPGQVFDVRANVNPQQGEAVQNVIRMVGVNTNLPDNSLFVTHPEAGSHYLVETDPRFTQQKPFMGSDYMLNVLLPKVQQPEDMFKRLGDGFYEQRLVREQVVALSGQRYLEGYSNDEEQFKGLMDAGITFAQQYNLRLGVALTPEQMSLLTSDMVWLVAQNVTLPDGSVQQVLVPQVYARVKPGDVNGSGALLAGNNVSLKLDGDLLNSGTIAGREVVQLSADNITNQGGRIQGADISLQARTDINNFGGTVMAQDSLFASAGRDINISSSTRTAQSTNGINSFERTTLDRVAGLYVQGNDGLLVLQAGRDLNVTAAQIVNSGENSITQLVAGRDLTLNTVTTGSRDSLIWNKNNSLNQGDRQDVGSEIIGNGAVILSAGNDLNARAATIAAGDELKLFAGNDMSIVSGESQHDLDERHQTTGSGFLSKTTTTTRDQFDITTAQSSNLSGDSITMIAGNNLLVQGSSVVGENDVALLAGNDLTITGATERSTESHESLEKKSGFSGSGGIGISYGTQSLKTTDDAQSLTNFGSTVGSVGGDVTLGAGNNLSVVGSDLIAGQDMALSGKNVSIMAAEEQNSQTHKMEQQTSGLTLALSGSVGSAASGAVETVQQAKDADSGRLAALEGVQAVLSGAGAVQAGRLSEAQGNDPANNNAIGISLSYGSQSSSSSQYSEQHTSQGSTLMAGDNLNITAFGDGIKGSSGDITVQGSQIQTGKDLTLDANRDINLISGLNTQLTTGENESQGGTFGVGIGVGQGGWGISISASGNKSSGSESGNGTTHSETTLDAGGGVTLISGRDTNLIGAQVSGESIKADIGRDLTLISEQDSDHYESEQKSASAGGSISFGGGSGSISLSKDQMYSNYDSVTDQTGMFAGKGGFDITVGNHTQLDGAVIASTAQADKNRLDTGTLEFSDIQNKADFETEHQGIGISTGGGSAGDQFIGNMASNLLANGGNDGHADSTTHAAISDGTIVIRDQGNQTQNVDDLSRDAEHANQSLSPIFDKEKEQQRLQEVQLIAEIGNQVADIARTEGAIAATNVAKDKMNNVTDADRAKAEGQWTEDHPGKTPTADDINSQIYETAYNQAFTDSGFGTGGSVQRGIQAATAAIQGLAGGDLTAAVANGAAPYIAKMIADSTDDLAARALAHAAVNAAIAAAQGNNALVGAGGAVTGELLGMIAVEAYGKPVSELSETEKQTVSALATLAAGLAGGLIGDSSSDAIAAAQAGKVTVENNYLHADDEKARQDAKWSLPYLEGEKKEQAEKLITELNAKDKALDAALEQACQTLSSAGCQAMRQDLVAAGKSYDEIIYGTGFSTLEAVYGEGAEKVDSLMWQYATADAKAVRDSTIQAMASSYDLSLEEAEALYDGMTFIHGAAAIGGAVYGLKGGVASESEIGVPVSKSNNPLSPVQQRDAFGNEIYYRSMSEEHFEMLQRTGVLPATGETSISPVLSYSSKYDGIAVKFTLAPSTSAMLQEIGIAANKPASVQLPNLSTQTGKWNQTNARFKIEGGQMSTQLGQGSALDIFNSNIIQFNKIH
ncbi:filamentous hemagglutinin [Rahnella sp. AA]|uniref:two-partner secretion domain-containing protein n=1 Tax=Rahnella sp. AA TaxID=2057180 RepID=UPI000C34821D|nr:hemagglutinin repeat-containing protein [Rahnella sp. AA]PKE30568.1 filamentous hemagglutinin [Rahnella sp. AA]